MSKEPFGTFEACQAKVRSWTDAPVAFCAWVKREAEGGREASTRPTSMRLAATEPREGELWPVMPLPDEKEPPTELVLFEWGVNPTVKGDMVLDAEAVAMIFTAHEAMGIARRPIDYEHGMLPDDPDGRARLGTGEVVAAGWYTPRITMGPSGAPRLVAAEIQWTPRAAQKIRDREFVHHSPAVIVDGKSRRIKALINAALTNLPATVGQAQMVAASETHKEKKTMKMPEPLRAKFAALMEHDYEDEEKMGTAIQALMAELFPPPKEQKPTDEGDEQQLVALSGKGTVGEALAVFTAWRDAHVGVAGLTATVQKLSEEVAAGKKRDRLATYDAKIAEGVAARKLSPADVRGETETGKVMLAWRERGDDGLQLLSTLLSTLQPKVPVATPVEPQGSGVAAALSDEERRIDGIFERGRAIGRPPEKPSSQK